MTSRKAVGVVSLIASTLLVAAPASGQPRRSGPFTPGSNGAPANPNVPAPGTPAGSGTPAGNGPNNSGTLPAGPRPSGPFTPGADGPSGPHTPGAGVPGRNGPYNGPDRAGGGGFWAGVKRIAGGIWSGIGQVFEFLWYFGRVKDAVTTVVPNNGAGSNVARGAATRYDPFHDPALGAPRPVTPPATSTGAGIVR